MAAYKSKSAPKNPGYKMAAKMPASHKHMTPAQHKKMMAKPAKQKR